MSALASTEDRAGAAAEYVLGTLDASDRAAFEAAAAVDRALRADVYYWQDRLLPLTAQIPEHVPSSALWSRIDAGVGAFAAAKRPAPSSSIAPWWQRVRVWQAVSALAVAASLLLAIALVTSFAAIEPTARYVAVLQSPDSQATGYIVEVTGRSVRLVPVAQDVQVPAGRALQFWTKPQSASAPTSLGLVNVGQTVVLPVSRLPAVEAQTLFEITLEPENGSPIGRPTGPILYVGRSFAL